MRVLIVTNNQNPRALDAARELAVWLQGAGHEPVLPPADAEALGQPGLALPGGGVGLPGLAVALGGDGTILKAVHVLEDLEVPLLGVNLGRLGFLSGAEADELRSAVGEALAGEARIERRATLQAVVEAGGRETARHRALNEVVVSRSVAGRVVDLEVRVNGTLLARFVCDGLIVATPTGSTAYALSAGGPVVSPEARALLVVPVAPHALATRTFVLGPSDIVEVACPNPARADVCVTVDGEAMSCPEGFSRVTVWRGEHDVLLVKAHDRDFYEVVRTKFLGG